MNTTTLPPVIKSMTDSETRRKYCFICPTDVDHGRCPSCGLPLGSIQHFPLRAAVDAMPCLCGKVPPPLNVAPHEAVRDGMVEERIYEVKLVWVGDRVRARHPLGLDSLTGTVVRLEMPGLTWAIVALDGGGFSKFHVEELAICP